MRKPIAQEYSGINEIFRRDEQTGIQCGINDLGRLFIGDTLCWYNMENTPENREKLLADFEYAVKQKKEQDNPHKMAPAEWQNVDYKFQVNAAHIKAIYDILDKSIKQFGRQPDRDGIEVTSFLRGVEAALSVIAANSSHVWDWCHIQSVNRNYFDWDE